MAKSPSLTALAAFAAVFGLSAVAHATPYAFASNQITNLRITYADGSQLTGVTTATTSISDSAVFDAYSGSVNQTSGAVGSASTINQAYSGPGPAPAATYTAQPAGSFTGTRSDAAIGAGSASGGGVSVSNVAEGYGAALGNSVGTNNAAIKFTVVGSGRALAASFTDLINLIASTAALNGETANAAIQNNFSLTQADSTTPLFSFSPSELNRQISSAAGTPATNVVGPSSFAESFVTPVLQAGVTYNIALTSTASETIIPGTSTPVPEPVSMSLLGTGLVGLGLVRRLRRMR